MNNLVQSLRGFLQSGKFATLTRVSGFWVLLGLLLAGLKHIQIQGTGSAGEPLAGGIMILATLALIAGLLRVDGGSLREIGLGLKSRNLPQFMVGVILGVVVVAGMLLVLFLLTPLKIEAAVNNNILTVLVVSFVVLLFLGLMEELAFRSYPLFRLRQAWGTRPAIYATSVVFAFYHGLSFENLLGPGVWGLIFGWMAMSTNSIALPTGFHVGLNWLQALMGMKPQYSQSIWELSIGTESAFFDVEAVGFSMQVTFLAVGILLIEILVKKQRNASGKGR